MNFAEILVLAMVIDAVFGEPEWLYTRVPHPAVLMGRVISWADTRYNQGANRRRKGVLVLCALGGSSVLLGLVLSLLPWGVQAIIVASLLAQKSLVDHVGAVANALRQSTPDARRAVARIVSRDTDAMNASAIARSAIESGSENFSDGVIAPIFWFLIAGLPGLLVYKVTNTADSMVGYRTARHNDFGWASARFDDLLNLFPARISAFLIALTQNKIKKWPKIRADAKLHKSPNAGWPESAMARALDVAVAGPRAYNGEMRPLAWVNLSGRKTIGAVEIDACCRALWRAWALGFGGLLIAALL